MPTWDSFVHTGGYGPTGRWVQPQISDLFTKHTSHHAACSCTLYLELDWGIRREGFEKIRSYCSRKDMRMLSSWSSSEAWCLSRFLVRGEENLCCYLHRWNILEFRKCAAGTAAFLTGTEGVFIHPSAMSLPCSRTSAPCPVASPPPGSLKNNWGFLVFQKQTLIKFCLFT